MGAACAGDDAEVDFGLAKFGGWGGEDDVGGEGEFAAAAELEEHDEDETCECLWKSKMEEWR